MKARTIYVLSIAAATLATASQSQATRLEGDFEKERQTILGMAGCYLVDYSYSETESLKPGYTLDSRVYDGSSRFFTKEWIFATSNGPRHIRLQHILFATDGKGRPIFVMKHQGEDWEYEPEFLYDFVGDSTWNVEDTSSRSGVWVRKVTNLDDGLRYQCAAAWTREGSSSESYPEWKCDNFSPIPGRETRDMGRKDYNTLQRSTRIIAHEGSWLERQNNVKTIYAGGTRTPLAREVGKIWYVRQPDSACAAAQAWAKPRQSFWKLLQGVWAEYFTGDRPFQEAAMVDGVKRFDRIQAIEGKYHSLVTGDAATAEAARKEIRAAIELHRR